MAVRKDTNKRLRFLRHPTSFLWSSLSSSFNAVFSCNGFVSWPCAPSTSAFANFHPCFELQHFNAMTTQIFPDGDLYPEAFILRDLKQNRSFSQRVSDLGVCCFRGVDGPESPRTLALQTMRFCLLLSSRGERETKRE